MTSACRLGLHDVFHLLDSTCAFSQAQYPKRHGALPEPRSRRQTLKMHTQRVFKLLRGSIWCPAFDSAHLHMVTVRAHMHDNDP